MTHTPPAGLDSVMAEEAMAFVAALCASPSTTIIATIHQPSEAIFNLSQDLVLLGKGGRVCYAGKTRDAVAFVGQACRGLPSLPAPGGVRGLLSSEAKRGTDRDRGVGVCALPCLASTTRGVRRRNALHR